MLADFDRAARPVGLGDESAFTELVMRPDDDAAAGSEQRAAGMKRVAVPVVIAPCLRTRS